MAMSDIEGGNSPVAKTFDNNDLNHLASEIVEELKLDDASGSKPIDSHLTLSDGTRNFQARSYQIEMLEESLQRNIIVAMDTGSGKTHIAIMRMLHDLEQLSPTQMIWFLAPTVALCQQQYETIEAQISSVQVKFLSGADGVDRWTSQQLWDDVLKNTRIIVCTYQILQDAMTHGFVRVESIGLIVFDEAHNCVGKHAGAKIMSTFYHPRKAQGLPVPHILGLTASPVMRSNMTSLGKIEQTLDSICRTPTKHRAELRLQVNRPVLSHIYFQGMQGVPNTKSVQALSRIYAGLDIEADPFMKHLRKDKSKNGLAKLEKVLRNRKTYSQDQMKAFHATSVRIQTELGAWAADYYILQVITNFLKFSDLNGRQATDISSAEQKYLAEALEKVTLNTSIKWDEVESTSLSDKATKLIECLLQQQAGFSGIVFVQERAMVAVLCNILSLHPATKSIFRLGMMVGTSVSAKRTRNLSELIEVNCQNDSLSLFRSGAIDLIIATSVLEEGLDIKACNMVVCFQKPANLKSFVQRRGRARHRQSKLLLMVEQQEKLSDWVTLEQEMKNIYEDETRALNEFLEVEDSEEATREYRVEATKAVLDLDNAVQHLYHFCATLPPSPYVDLRPEFIVSDADHKLVRARVYLPVSVDKAVRVAGSRSSWMSEKNAIKDAAFEAYLALYHAGLVNDNMLPLLRHDDATDNLLTSAVEERASIISVDEQRNPWIDVASAWINPNLQHSTMYFNDIAISIVLPVPILTSLNFQLYWDSQTEFSVSIAESHSFPAANIIESLNETLTILKAAFGHRFSINQKPTVAIFTFQDSTVLKLGQQPVNDGMLDQSIELGLIRHTSKSDIGYIPKSCLRAKPPRDLVQHPYEGYDTLHNDTPHFSVIRLPKRADFLHRILPGNDKPSRKPHSVVLPITECTVDAVAFKYVQFGLMIPSIMRQIEIHLLASLLSSTILSDAQLSLDLVVSAISASSAQETGNYQRLEFIGDSVLKFCTSVQIIAQFPLWHQGYLSAKKDRIISNARLSRAAVESGLAQFIVTKAFTGSKWRPLYVDELLEKPRDGKREMSTKTLADVVEALVGVAMVDGGIDKSLLCLQAFLPDQEWQPLETRRLYLYHLAPDLPLPPVLESLESLLGYIFAKKALLIEAMSHPSYTIGTCSYERLEFLGDSILDFIIVEALRKYDLSHVQMHRLRTALVNAEFLGFVCMELAIEQERIDIAGTTPNGTGILGPSKMARMPLWAFMRHQSPEISKVHVATIARYNQFRDAIVSAMETGVAYPWALLARVQIMKFYSDLVESLVAALWIDSGSFAVCERFVEKLGILPYLRRLLGDNVDVWHPKEKLGLLAVEKPVKYTVEERPSTLPAGGKEFACSVTVGDEFILLIDGGVSKEEVMTKAADAAVEIMGARGGESTEIFGDRDDRDVGCLRLYNP
ncbi:hypothetical protein BJ878DRAFT_539949 [Calycina marina]|uniref:Dicer-like protein 2 n=1 Tax=Calycina marina TaxID=1763456 RepID=A0A9P8CHG9_9HELO|nr:hypothetical protein BJ878DRAFT_539949 [Calycina marina]